MALQIICESQSESQETVSVSDDAKWEEECYDHGCREAEKYSAGVLSATQELMSCLTVSVRWMVSIWLVPAGVGGRRGKRYMMPCAQALSNSFLVIFSHGQARQQRKSVITF